MSGDGNIFKPGTLTGAKPTLTQYSAGTYAYNTDRNNLGPNAGAAWQVPGQGSGLGRMVLGSQEGDTVIRGGFAMAYQRPGMSDFTGVFGANQGLSVALNRDAATGNLGTLPLLLRNTSSLTLANAPVVTFPIVPVVTGSLNTFDSNLQLPYTHSYSVGWQRKLGRDTAVEVRYVGSRHRHNATFRANGVKAGLPANFFLANPDITGGANLTTNSGGTRASSVQVEFRKRMSKGLALSTSYSWSSAYVAQRYGFSKPLEDVVQTGQVGNVHHALKANWLYDLPFGRDHKWGSGVSSFMNQLIGGWEIDGVARIQTGEMVDFGNVRLVGMTEDEFRKAVDLRVGTNGQLFILPDDIIQNTVRAFNVSATSASGYGALGAPTGRYLAPANGPDCIETAPGYGDCGIRSLVANAPRLVRFDLSAVKRVRLHGSLNFEFRAELLNAFNNPYFNPASTAGTPIGMSTAFSTSGGPAATGTPTANTTAASSGDGFRLTSLLGDNTARIIQLVWRVRW